MPHYVQIKNTETGRTFPLNADVWEQEKERQKNNKSFKLVEVQPVKVTIPRKANVEVIEKKSQDVVVDEVKDTQNELEIIHADNTPNDLAVSDQELPKIELAEKEQVEPERKEPKKRGRPSKK